MKYQRTERFVADYRRLSVDERTLFREAVRQMNDAYTRRGAQPLPSWPATLRVKSVRSAPGIWEMTWSFAGPDGRATFELITIDGEPAIRWRRVGDHRIFEEP
ncbi:MAG TPA: hypothetical protein VFW96_24535 [Thermomicrobiales bacterium]|nr:hypothetical protein [Thermomicrobiales bacterium]